MRRVNDDGGRLKVALDAQSTIGTATGIGEYVRGLLASLTEAGIDPVPLRFAPLDLWRFDRRVAWDQVVLPLAAARSGAAVLHCTSGTIPLLSPLPVVATVHDLAWLRTQGHTRAYARWYFGRFSLARYQRARRLIVDSQFSHDELLACADVDPATISVVYPGVDAAFMHVERSPGAAATILAVGTVEPRKNLAAVIAALPALPGARLISVGPSTPYQGECTALAERTGVAERVSFRGYVTRAEVLELYARATVAVAPSHYEGFGYAAAQALCAGIPLVAARSSSLIEVAAGGGRLVDPDDIAGWIDALAAILNDSGAAERSAAAGRSAAASRFGWSSSAAATAAVYRLAVNAGD